jgi:hypothetical protein
MAVSQMSSQDFIGLDAAIIFASVPTTIEAILHMRMAVWHHHGIGSPDEREEMARAKTLDHLALVHGKEMPMELLVVGLAEFVLMIHASAVIAERE